MFEMSATAGDQVRPENGEGDHFSSFEPAIYKEAETTVIDASLLF
jgi:hypothetical protein